MPIVATAMVIAWLSSIFYTHTMLDILPIKLRAAGSSRPSLSSTTLFGLRRSTLGPWCMVARAVAMLVRAMRQSAKSLQIVA